MSIKALRTEAQVLDTAIDITIICVCALAFALGYMAVGI